MEERVKNRPPYQWQIFSSGHKVYRGPNWLFFLMAYTICLGIGLYALVHFGELFIWPSTGVMVAGILVLPKQDAMILALCGTLLNFLGLHLDNDNSLVAGLYAALDILEVFLAVTLTRRYCGANLDLSSNRRLRAFVFCAAVPAALFRGIIDSLTHPIGHPDLILNTATLLMTDILAMVILVPLILGTIRQSNLPERSGFAKMSDILLFCISIALATAVFIQSSLPFVFITMIPLVWVAFRFSQVEALWVSIFVIGIAYFTTMSGHGPIAIEGPGSETTSGMLSYLSDRLFLMHLYALSLVGIILPINSLMNDDRKLKQRILVRAHTVAQALQRALTAEKNARHLAENDLETGLPNRPNLITTVAELMKVHDDVHVAAFTINRFTELRSSIGQTLASEIVKQVAARISEFPETRSVARLSQAELGIVFHAQNNDEAYNQLHRIVQSFEDYILVQNIGVDVRVTAGLGLGNDALTLVHSAQTAVYQAFASEKPVTIFSAEMEKTAAIRLTMLSDLHKGLENGEVWVSFQPKLNLKTGELYCAECLIRWNHPTIGVIGPEQFIPIAEETGFIDPLTMWIVKKAVAAHLALREMGLPPRIAINISAHSIWSIEFAKEIAAIVTNAGTNPCYFTLEITETGIMKQSSNSIRTLQTLRKFGFNISIDDYGSGQSSLRYLKTLPATELKIDNAFVTNLANDPKDALLVRSTIELAHGLGLNVVAEGVEDEAALAKLRMFGCDVAQGFHIAYPMSLEKLIKHYRANSRQMVA